MNCKKCGAPLNEKDAFCKKCGSLVGFDNTPSQPEKKAIPIPGSVSKKEEPEKKEEKKETKVEKKEEKKEERASINMDFLEIPKVVSNLKETKPKEEVKIPKEEKKEEKEIKKEEVVKEEKKEEKESKKEIAKEEKKAEKEKKEEKKEEKEIKKEEKIEEPEEIEEIKRSNIGLIIAIIIIIFLLIVSIFFGYQYIKNKKSEAEIEKTNGAQQNLYRINFEGYQLDIPQDYIYYVSGDKLYVSDSQNTWYAAIQIVEKSYEEINTNKAIERFRKLGYHIALAEEKNISNRKYYAVELQSGTKYALVAYSKADANHLFAFTAYNPNFAIDYAILENISSILDSATYLGEPGTINQSSMVDVITPIR